MANIKKVVPSVERILTLPIDLSTRVDLELYSELEGRVPYGARQRFFTQLLRDYFAQQDHSTSLIEAAVKPNHTGE